MSRAIHKMRTSPPPVLTLIGSTTLTNNTSTYTYTDHAIGVASGDRLVVVAFGAGDTASVSSTTIGGSGADIVAQVGQTNDGLSCIFQRLVTSGTTATIVINLSDSAVHSHISVYTLTGLKSTTALDSGTSKADDVTSRTVSLTTQNHAAIIAVAEIYAGNPTLSWTGSDDAAEDNEEAYGGEDGTGGDASGVAAGTSSDVVVTHASADSSLTAACWR